ncbi:hypothetical protein CROQUDRAFT_673797 [Cronartium quercuum f. sp. fusiforme G11]|uniref:DUF7872 domain-containing protein n=1 Tax=Cronartium quercuum f. sp. fusiforme G11 TaxID=708437 RepID=A0A9P6T7X6_9BASI|nr:hypothetical protein CROQUDRAFT_673797 [Cronartium quercuum f. sp. fusiforme G11]
MGASIKPKTSIFGKLWISLFVVIYYASVARPSPTIMVPQHLIKRQIAPTADGGGSVSNPQPSNAGPTSPAAAIIPPGGISGVMPPGAPSSPAPSDGPGKLPPATTVPSSPLSPLVASSPQSTPIPSISPSVPQVTQATPEPPVNPPTSIPQPGSLPEKAVVDPVPQINPSPPVSPSLNGSSGTVPQSKQATPGPAVNPPAPNPQAVSPPGDHVLPPAPQSNPAPPISPSIATNGLPPLPSNQTTPGLIVTPAVSPLPVVSPPGDNGSPSPSQSNPIPPVLPPLTANGGPVPQSDQATPGQSVSPPASPQQAVNAPGNAVVAPPPQSNPNPPISPPVATDGGPPPQTNQTTPEPQVPPPALPASVGNPPGNNVLLPPAPSNPIPPPPGSVGGPVLSSNQTMPGPVVNPPVSPSMEGNSSSPSAPVTSAPTQGAPDTTPVPPPANITHNDSLSSANVTGNAEAAFTGLPAAPGQNSTDEFTALPPAPDQTNSTEEFSGLPPGPGQSQPDATSPNNSSSDFTGLPPAPGQNQSDSSNEDASTENFTGLPPGPDQTSLSDDASDLLGDVRLPISHETWVQLKMDEIIMQQNITINEYARKNKGGNFICGIGENCHAGQLFHPVKSPAWQLLYAAQEYNHFMNAMFDSVKYTLSMLQSTSASMTNDLFEDITDSRLVLDLKWVFTDLYRGITYGAVAALVMVLFGLGLVAGGTFIIVGTAFGAGLAAWIQGTPKTITYQSWTQLSFYIAESQDQILSSIDKNYSESLAAPMNSHIGLSSALMGGNFFQPTSTYGIMEAMEKKTKHLFQARLLSRMLRQNNAFVTISDDECKGPGPGGSWGGNDVISYCDREEKLLYNVIRAHKKKSLNTIYGASAIINKYGFSAEYITKTSWICQQKYGRFEHDVGLDMVGKVSFDLNEDCAVNLPVCDTRLPVNVGETLNCCTSKPHSTNFSQSTLYEFAGYLTNT